MALIILVRYKAHPYTGLALGWGITTFEIRCVATVVKVFLLPFIPAIDPEHASHYCAGVHNTYTFEGV